MKKKIQVLFLVLLGLCSLCKSTLFAQRIYVFSSVESTPLKNARVLYKLNPDKGFQLLLSEKDGSVNLNLPENKYPIYLKIEATNYLSFFDTLYNHSEQKYFLNPLQKAIEEVVITGQYAPGTVDKAVHVIKIVNRETIDRMAAQNLREVLSRSLNIRLNQDNILGSSMSLQGISGQDVKILIDGVPIIGRQNGDIDLSQINMNNVARIEIVEGPLSVNYGTDALAGAINIITQQHQQNAYLANADLYYESNGNYNASGKVGFEKKNHKVQFTLGRNFFDGWWAGEKPFTYKKEILPDSSRFQSWKPKEQYFGGLLYAQKIKNLNLRVSSQIFDENIYNFGYPRAPYGESAMDDQYYTFRNDNAIALDGKIKDRYHTNFILSYNLYRREKNTFLKDLTTLEKELTAGNGDQDTSVFHAWMFRGQMASTKNQKANYELGYDLNYQINTGQQISGHTKDMGDFALFASAEYRPIKPLTLKPGVRIAYNTQFSAPLIPSLNLKYDIPFSEGDINNLILRASYAKGFRAPDLKELYFDFVDVNHNIQGNPDLKAEYSDNFILNAVYGKHTQQNSFKLEWNNFYNKIRNMIVLAQMPGSSEYTYANLGFFQTFGTNLTAQTSMKNWSVAVGTGLIGTYNQLYSEHTQHDKFTYSPEINGNLSYDWVQQGWTFAFFYKYTGKQPGYFIDADDEVQQSITQSYQMADVSIGKSLWRNQLKITVGSKNLFNITNISGSVNNSPHSSGTLSTPLSMGRTYFLGASLNLNYQ